MKSATGAYYPALDHVRALAAFMVFNWHFMHRDGYPVALDSAPAFIFSAINQGHTGVALFMTLSGYLFAKLIGDKKIHYKPFFWNRFIRLTPLLVFVFIAAGFGAVPDEISFSGYLLYLLEGLVIPQWPNGAWSIAIEMKYYLLLPFLIFVMRKNAWTLLFITGIFLCIRIILYQADADIHRLAYYTLLGRIDQFLLGMLAYRCAGFFRKKHLIMAIASLSFLLIYHVLDVMEVFYNEQSWHYPFAWVFIPTLEGAFYGVLIAWYDQSFSPSSKGASGFIARIGQYSYSIYLFHFFFVFMMTDFIHTNVMDISSFYIALPWSVLCFTMMVVPGHLSYKCIEEPFLRYRKRYVSTTIEKSGTTLDQQSSYSPR